MKKLTFAFGLVICLAIMVKAQIIEELWKPSQLMETKTLASLIEKNQAKKMLILSIGPDAVIKGSVNIGPTNDKGNVEKLKSYLKNVKKDKEVVIYCGCCPFSRCPNIRPAFKTLMSLGYKNAKLLNVPNNIKTDWIDKDYPTED
ncbi:rhodanese-like domain-containing protein [Chryseobacterium oryctis]|uniref:Rhodanese-like domain-containing protein n=1 Tax=Chryseobacterium oryctis TaxID=2952618 RepID=A0ABT3HNW5_9FLAO|nr:rhodanese-like domain-containing protein [Chryseobacterium oryctis]MCW3161475.1 rhodanese-like domain-containing protein [Chryseobacterium oryctis]